MRRFALAVALVGCSRSPLLDPLDETPPRATPSTSVSTSASSSGAGGAFALDCGDDGSPETLTVDAAGDFELATDGDWIYFTNYEIGTVRKVHLCGNPVPPLVQDQPTPYAIAVDDTRMYWSTVADGAIRSANKIDGSDPVILTKETGQPHAIAVDATRVYWTVSEAFGVGAAGVWSIAKTGGEPQQHWSGAATKAIAVDGAFIYFSELIGVAQGLLYALPKLGGEAKVLAPFLVQGRLTLTEDDVYVATWQSEPEYDANVLRVPKSGGTPQTLAKNEPGPVRGVAVSGDFIAFTSQDAAAVKAAPKIGGPPFPIATDLVAPEQIVATGLYVIWADYGGAIVRARVAP